MNRSSGRDADGVADVVGESGESGAGDDHPAGEPSADDSPSAGQAGPDPDDDAAGELSADETPSMGQTAPDRDEGDDGVEWSRIDWIACGVLLLCSVVLVGLHVRAYTTLSPIDELQHVDYTLKAGRFEVPHKNDLVGFEAMSEAACRSVDAPQYAGPECGLDEYEPANFQENGINTAASQFPPYYTVTGLTARAITGTGLLDSSVSAARMVGALWAAAAWSVIWYLFAMFGVPRPQRAIALAVLIATPLTLFHAATVNADAVLLLTGSLALLATLKFERGKLSGWLLLPIYVALFFVEATNILAIAACSVYLVVRVSVRTDLTWMRRAVPVVALVSMLLLRLELAARLRNRLFPPSPRLGGTAPMFTEHRADGVSWDKVFAQLDATFMPVGRAYLPPLLRTQHTVSFIQLTNWLLIGSMFLVAFGIGFRTRAVWLSRVGMAALLAAGPFYTFSFAYFSGSDFPAPGRFGLPLLPVVAVVVASAWKTRASMVIATAVAAGSVCNTLYLLLAAQ